MKFLKTNFYQYVDKRQEELGAEFNKVYPQSDTDMRSTSF